MIVRGKYARANEPVWGRVARVQPFLEDLRDVANVLGLVVVGRSDQRWNGISMESMISMVQSDFGIHKLHSLMVRVFPCRAYLRRWQRYFAEGGHLLPSGDDDMRCETDGNVSATELFHRLAALGVSQSDLALVLRVSSSFVCLLRHDRRRWPPGVLRRVMLFLNAVESSVVGTIDGPWQPLGEPLQSAVLR